MIFMSKNPVRLKMDQIELVCMSLLMFITDKSVLLENFLGTDNHEISK